MAAALSPAQALGQSLHRELTHLRDNRWDRNFIVLVPLLCLLVLGWLFSAGVMRQIPIALVDEDHSAQSRALARMLDASPGLAIARQPVDMAAAQSQLRALEVFAIVRIPEGLAREGLRGQGATLHAFYNATYLATGQSAAREIGDVVTAFNADLLRGQTAALAGPANVRVAPVAVQARLLFNPSRSFALFLFPMTAAATLSLCMALATVAAFGRELRAPALWPGPYPWAAALGKLLPYLAVFAVQLALALAYSAWCLGDGLAGSVVLLGIGIVLFLLASAGMGLLLLGLTRDMGVSLSLTGMVMGTALAFSGATFPVVDGPAFTRFWNHLLPLTPWLELQNQLLMVGSPAADVLRTMAGLLPFVLLCGPLGLARLFATLRARAQQEARA